MKSGNKIWAFLALIFFALFCLGFCQKEGLREKICSDSCVAPSKPAITVLTQRTKSNNEWLYVPYSKPVVRFDDGTMYTPGDIERIPDGDKFIESKRRELNANCFSSQEYVPTDLADITLNEGDVTITVLNFDDEGRLESYDLKNSAGDFDAPLGGLFGSINNYQQIQNYLSNMSRLDVTYSTSPDYLNPRIINSGVSSLKTPFYGNPTLPIVTNQTGVDEEKGHVYFYILADAKLKFNRNFPAIAHTPQAQNAIDKLYSPFFKYPFSNSNANLEVLVMHFKRGGTMTDGMSVGPDGEVSCRYPYDLGVIAEGQTIVSQKTPLLIDPEVDAKGSLPD